MCVCDDMVDHIKVGQRRAELTVSSDTPFRTGCDLRYCPCTGRINESVRPTQKKQRSWTQARFFHLPVRIFFRKRSCGDNIKKKNRLSRAISMG